MAAVTSCENRELSLREEVMHVKNSSGFNEVRTDFFCNAGAMLCQLTEENTQLGAGQLLNMSRHVLEDSFSLPCSTRTTSNIYI